MKHLILILIFTFFGILCALPIYSQTIKLWNPNTFPDGEYKPDCEDCYIQQGVNSAAMHGLFIHYVVGLWLTPAGLATIYYFIPLSAKNPLYSHRLSLLGFWSLALFYTGGPLAQTAFLGGIK